MIESERRAYSGAVLDGGKLTGVIPVGVVADDRAEVFAPGSLEVSDRLTLDLQHDARYVVATMADGTLSVEPTPAGGLAVTAAVDGPMARLVEGGGLTALSPEFFVLKESTDSAGNRVIEKAIVHTIGLVDVGAYDAPVAIEPSGRAASFDPVWT